MKGLEVMAIWKAGGLNSCFQKKPFILCMGTLSRLLLAENRDIKFLRFFAKIKNDREGGVRGGGSYFSWTKEGTRVSHAKFQVSRSIPSYRYFLQKSGGEGGGPIILLVEFTKSLRIT